MYDTSYPKLTTSPLEPVTDLHVGACAGTLPPFVSPGANDQHHQCTKAIISPHFSSIEPDRPVDQPQQAADPNSILLDKPDQAPKNSTMISLY